MHIQIPSSPEAIKFCISTKTDDTFKLWSAIYTLNQTLKNNSAVFTLRAVAAFFQSGVKF